MCDEESLDFITEVPIHDQSDDALYCELNWLRNKIKTCSPYSSYFKEVVTIHNDICHELWVRNHGIDD